MLDSLKKILRPKYRDMNGKRKLRLLTAGERARIEALHPTPLEWHRKARNTTAFPAATIRAARDTLGISINYLNDQWYVVEIK